MSRKISSVQFHSHHEARGGAVTKRTMSKQLQGLNIVGGRELRWEVYIWREEEEEVTVTTHGYSPFCTKCPLIFCPIFHLRPVL
jgi:hypothetical protein